MVRAEIASFTCSTGPRWAGLKGSMEEDKMSFRKMESQWTGPNLHLLECAGYSSLSFYEPGLLRHLAFTKIGEFHRIPSQEERVGELSLGRS